jgi:hypothetical protein
VEDEEEERAVNGKWRGQSSVMLLLTCITRC